jgi:flagellar biosynthesis component FlhA
MVPSTYALHRAGNLAPSLLPSLPCVSLVLFLSPAVLYIFPIAAKRKKREKKKAQEKSESKEKKKHDKKKAQGKKKKLLTK